MLTVVFGDVDDAVSVANSRRIDRLMSIVPERMNFPERQIFLEESKAAWIDGLRDGMLISAEN